MQLFAKSLLTWYEPPALAALVQRVHASHPSPWNLRKVLVWLLAFLLVTFGPLPLLDLWTARPDDIDVHAGAGIGLALLAWLLGAAACAGAVWFERSGRRLPVHWYVAGRRCWLGTWLALERCARMREYMPVHIACEGYDVHAICYTDRRGAMHIVGVPEAGMAARVDELLAAAGVPRGLPYDVQTWNDFVTLVEHVRTSARRFTWTPTQAWRIVAALIVVMVMLPFVVRGVFLGMWFMTRPIAKSAIVPTCLIGCFDYGAAAQTYTTAWAVFAVPGPVTQATTRSDGRVRIVVPPVTLYVRAAYQPEVSTNLIAYAPQVVSGRLMTDALCNAPLTNLLATPVDKQEAAWVTRPLPVWRMACAGPRVFWAEMQIHICRSVWHDADTVTLVHTPHVNGIIYYAWEGSTARVAHVLLQDHERARMTSATLCVPPAARGQLTRAATAFAASFQFVSPHQSCP